MELTVKTLRGSCVLNVKDNTTVSELKQLLHDQYQDVATLKHDRLVFRQAHLENHVLLQQAGVVNGDQLVLLEASQLQKPGALDTCPAPDVADIRRAITEEARRRGIEHTITDERPSAAQQRRRFALPRELLGSLGGVDEQLVQFLEQALDGQFQMEFRLSGSGDGQVEGDEEGAEEQELQVPEPLAAHISQLTDMGFAEAVARKALILTRDSVQMAVEWLFEHGDDANAADPPTQEQLRQVYGRRRSRRRQGAAVSVPTPPPAGTQTQSAAAGSSEGGSETVRTPGTEAASSVPMEVALTQLTEMGFDAAAAQQALDRVGPHLELAMGMLLGQGLSAAIARERGSSSGDGSSQHIPETDGLSAGAAGAGVGGGGSAAAPDAEAAHPPEAAADDGAEYETAEEDNDEDYDDEEEEDYVDYDDESEAGEEHIPLHALAGTMGSMDLNGLGSADMEQLLQGVAVQELYGNHLLMAGSIEGGMGGAASQGSLLRLMEAPGILQQMVTALQEPEQREQQPPSQQQQQAGDSSSGQLQTEQPGAGDDAPS